MDEMVGHVRLTFNDDEAITGLKRYEETFKRSMDRIEKERAVVDVTANIDQLRKKLAQARADIEKFEGQEKEAARARAKSYREDIRAQQDLLREKRTELSYDRLMSKEHATKLRLMDEEAKHERNMAKSREDEYRNAVSVAKMQQRLVDLQRKSERIRSGAGYGRLERFIPAVQEKIKIDERAAVAEMEMLRAKLTAMGEKPVHINVDMDDSVVTKWAKSLSEMSLRVGPVTTTIAQFSKILLLFGPIITNVVGALGSLVGVMGAGVAGAAGIGGAAVTGLGQAFGGIFAIVKPAVNDFKEFIKVQKAYNTAVLEHGKNSGKAGKALKVLQNVTKGLPPDIMDAVRSFAAFQTRWNSLTKIARPAVFRTIADAIKTAGDLMPDFAARSVRAVQHASNGFGRFFQLLRGGGGRDLDTIFGQFNDSIEPLAGAFTNLTKAALNLFTSFGRYLGPLSQGFERWTNGLADASEHTTRLNARVDTTVAAFRSVINIVQSATRFLSVFFFSSVKPGIGFVDDMSEGLDKMTRHMQTVAGQRSLQDFWKTSISGAQDLWNAISPLLKLFVEFARIMEPFTGAALWAAQLATGFTHMLAAIEPVRRALQVIFFGLFAKRTLGFLDEAAHAFVGFSRIIIGRLTAISAAEAGTSVFGGPKAGVRAVERGVAGQVAAGGASTGVLRGVSGFGRKAAPVAAGAAGAEAVGVLGGIGAAGLAATAGVAAVAGGVAYLGYKLITSKSSADKLRDALKGIGSTATGANDAFRSLVINIGDVGSNLQRSNIDVKQAKAALDQTKKGTDEYRVALLNYNDALRSNKKARADWANEALAVEHRANDALQARQKAVDTQKRLNEEEVKRFQETHQPVPGQSPEARAAEAAELAAIEAHGRKKIALLERLAREAANATYAAGSIEARGRQGLPALGPAAVNQIGALAQKMPALAVKVALSSPNTGDVAALAGKINSLLTAGVHPKSIVKILGDSTNADTSIKRLNEKLREIRDRRDIEAKLYADQHPAARTIEQLRTGPIHAFINSNPTTKLHVDPKPARTELDSFKAAVRESNKNPLSLKVALDMATFGGTVGGGKGGDGWGAGGARGMLQNWITANKGAVTKNLFSGGLGHGIATGTGLNAFNGLASKFGLSIGSGERPGAITSAGNTSYHALGRARDFPGTPAQMMAFARYMAATFGSRLKELIYTPLGFSIKNGQKVPPYAQSEHYNHVHVAMKQGGQTPPHLQNTRSTIEYAEEPGHPEFFIPTNPKFRNRARALWEMAGQNLGLVDAVGDFKQAASGGVAGLSGEQRSNLGIITRVGQSMTSSMRVLKAAIEAAWVESKLRNLHYGDRDSLGLFQQRASWGSAAARTNPAEAARMFFTKAIAANRGFTGSAGTLAGRVQRPAAQYLGRYSASSGLASQLLGTGGGDIYGGANRLEADIQHKQDQIDALRERKAKIEVKGNKAERAAQKEKKSALDDRIRLLQKGIKQDRRDLKRTKPLSEMPVHGATDTPERQLAIAQGRYDRAKETAGLGDDPIAALALGEQLKEQQDRDRARMAKINTALKGRLKPATRDRLLTEKTDITARMGTTAATRRKLGIDLTDTLNAQKYGTQEGVDAYVDYATTTKDVFDDIRGAQKAINYWQSQLATANKRHDVTGARQAQASLNRAKQDLIDKTHAAGDVLATGGPGGADQLDLYMAAAEGTADVADDVYGLQLRKSQLEKQIANDLRFNHTADAAGHQRELNAVNQQLDDKTQQLRESNIAGQYIGGGLPGLDVFMAQAEGTASLADDVLGWFTSLRIWQSILQDRINSGADPASIAEAQRQVNTSTKNLTDSNQQLREFNIAGWFIGGGMGGLDIFMAQAEGTADLSDDLQGYQTTLSIWQEILNSRIANGADPAAVAEAQRKVNSANDSIRGVNRQMREGPLMVAQAVAEGTTSIIDDIQASYQLVNLFAQQVDEATTPQERADAIHRLNSEKGRFNDLATKQATDPLNANLALAQLTDGTDDDLAANQALLDYHQGRLDNAKKLGDYAEIISEAGNVKQFTDAINTINHNTEDDVKVGLQALQEAALNLRDQFANNFTTIISAASATGSAMESFIASANSTTALATSVPVAALVASGTGGTSSQSSSSVTIVNNYSSPPEDPLIWSKGVQYELQAMGA
jgi:hypothetical protein